MEIVPASTPEYLAIVRQLFEEYWQSFGFTPCFQNFAAEVAGLPGYYAPPAGRLALALIDGEPVGCVALRAAGPFARGSQAALRAAAVPRSAAPGWRCSSG